MFLYSLICLNYSISFVLRKMTAAQMILLAIMPDCNLFILSASGYYFARGKQLRSIHPGSSYRLPSWGRSPTHLFPSSLQRACSLPADVRPSGCPHTPLMLRRTMRQFVSQTHQG